MIERRAKLGSALGGSLTPEKVRIAELQTLRVNQAVAELQNVERTIFELEEQLGAADDVFRRTVVRAPINGTVVGLEVHTPGGVIRPGQPLMHLVPSGERLLIDARISPNDVDVVAPGDPAHVRLTAFQQRHRTPMQGRLVSVSADHFVDERTGGSYYLGRVELIADRDQTPDTEMLYPGMQAEVMILTGRSTILDYVMEPDFREALRELEAVAGERRE